jgi:YfiR/HmsC-like
MRFTFILILFLGTEIPLRAQAAISGPTFDEYQVKAAFLYNFAKFVEWPSGTFGSTADSIVICVIGPNPFGSILEHTVQDKKIGERAFVVLRLVDTKQAGRCQILFIGAGESKGTRAFLEPLTGAAILTVGESDDFTALGGIVRFRLDGPRVRIQIALDTAERSRLRISSKLLGLAEIVKKKP